MYDIENESWTKNKKDIEFKTRIQYITYKFKSIKSERKNE